MPPPVAATAVADPQVRRWIRRRLAVAPPRAPSLIATVWGDAIAPRGGAAMLPGLIALLAAFGLSERLVRTSVFRLARVGWLEATPVGRKSLYRLTADGALRFERAHRRIYAAPVEDWDQTWELVVAARLPARERRALADELRWEGFGTFAPGTWARPARDPATVVRLLAARGWADGVVVARARDDPACAAAGLAAAVPRAWNLAALAADYRRFLQRYGAAIEHFRARAEADRPPAQSFVVRTLLIHDYRRLLLRDPQLPAALLPLDWPGAAAYALCRDFYRLAHRAAERHLTATLENASGPLPAAGSAFQRRFGGLAGR